MTQFVWTSPNSSAAHEVTGWNDYEFLNSAIDEPVNDSTLSQ